MNDPDDVSISRTRNAAARRHRGRQLALVGAVAVAALGGYRAYTTALQDPLLQAAGIAMIVLAAVPALVWASQDEERLPAFEVLMLTAIPFYALPLFDQKSALALFSTDVMQRAAIAVLVFQVTMLVANLLVGGRPGRSPLWRESLLPEGTLRYARIGLALTTLYLYVSQFTEAIPLDLASVLRALFYGVGMLCAFILIQLWGKGRLTGGEKSFVAANLALQVILQFASLYLIVAASLLLLVLISYTSASRKLPIGVALLSIALVAFLHLGKSQMRSIYWQPDAPRVGFSDLPGFFTEWAGYSLAAHAGSDEGMTSRLLERTSLFHVLCVAVESIPSRQPHLEGETNAIIPAQFIPRFFWSEKPGPHKSNARLAVYLGFVADEEAAQRVSIAFGTPSEAYVNFGLLGMMLLGAAYGALFKKLSTLTADSPSLSIGGILMVLLLAWSLQAEMTLAVWISSLYQAAIVLVGLPLGLKFLLGR